MPNTTDIIGLPVALAVDGTEDFPLVQGGTTKRAKTGLIMAGSSGASVQDANTVFAGPASAPAAAPSFRALVPADIPNGLPAGGDTGQQLVKLSDDDYDVGWVDDPAVPEPANTVLAGPVSGPDADPTFRSLVNGDLPTVDVSHGGSGRTSATAYAVLCGGTTATGAHQSVAGVGTLGQLLTSNGAGSLPTFQTAATAIGQPLTKTDDTNVTLTLGGTPSTALLSATSITAGWTGTLAATRGGTGFGSYTTGDVLYASSTSAFTRLNASTAGYLLQTNGAGTAPTWSGFLQSGTGATTRTWASKASDWFSVKDFGAVGDGATNDTTAINNAIAAAAAASSKRTVYLPAGTYNVTSLATIPTGITLVGENYQNTIIRTTSATATILTINATYVSVSNLGFASSTTQSAGAYIAFGASSGGCYVNNCLLSAPYRGMTFADGCGQIVIQDTAVFNAVASTGASLEISGALVVSFISVLCTNSSGAKPFAHMIVHNCGDVTLVNTQLILAESNLYFDPGSGQVCVSFKAVQSYFDQGGSYNLVMVPSSTGNIARCNFDGCWFGSAGTANINLAPSGGSSGIDAITFSDCDALLSSYGLAATGAGVSNCIWSNGKVAGNSAEGISLASVSSFQIVGTRIGNVGGCPANGTGIVISGTSDNVLVADNDLRGNTSAALTNSASGVAIVVRNNLPLSVNGALPVAEGGTGATSQSGARTALGLGTGDSPTFAGLTATGLVTTSRSVTPAGAGATYTINSAGTRATGGTGGDSFYGFNYAFTDDGSTDPLTTVPFRLVGTYNNAANTTPFNNVVESTVQVTANLGTANGVVSQCTVFAGTLTTYNAFKAGAPFGTVTTKRAFYAESGAGPIVTDDTTASTSTTSGALVVAGGAGIAGQITVGGVFRLNQTPTAIGTGAKTISNAADSSTNFGHYFSFSANGTTYYVPCSSVAPT